MNGVNYAEALVKARRYEIANEAATHESVEDTSMVAESVKAFVAEAKHDDSISAQRAHFNPNEWKVDKKTDKMVANDPKVTKMLDKKDDIMDGAKEVGRKAGNFVKDHKKALGIGAGVAAAGAAAAIAAKKIADKKKAAKAAEQEVKENSAYEEYETLVENVINHFMSEEEIMSENANEIAMATADYFIEHIDEM